MIDYEGVFGVVFFLLMIILGTIVAIIAVT